VTVIVIVSDFITADAPDPEVAVTTIAYVPAAVPPVSGGWVVPPLSPPPPHEVNTPIVATAYTSRRLTRVGATTSNSAPSNIAIAIPAGGVHTTIVLEPPAFGAVVEIVNVVETAAPLGVSVAGAKAHAVVAGNPEQVKLTAELKPPLGVSVRIAVTFCPAGTVTDVGRDVANAKSAATGAAWKGEQRGLFAASQSLMI
jgi:hypothetical protein